MRLNTFFASATMALGLAAGAAAANATIVSQDLSGSDLSIDKFYWGETFTTAAGGPWSNVTVNFYDASGAPAAAGTGYIFSSLYTGTPGDLPGAGALATSVATSGGTWQFAPGFKLASATQYYFYEDGLIQLVGDAFSSVNNYSFTDSTTSNYDFIGGVEINYSVNGVSVPEPATWAMMLVGVGCIGAALRGGRRRQAGLPAV